MNTGMSGPGMGKGLQQQQQQQQGGPQQQQHSMMMHPQQQQQGLQHQQGPMGPMSHQHQQYQQGPGIQHQGISPAMMAAAQQHQQHHHNQQQQQQQHSQQHQQGLAQQGPPGPHGPPPPPPPPPSMPIKDMNVSYLCRLGAEFVQEIASRTIDLFQILKSLSPQMTPQQQEERRIKVKDLTKMIDLHFKRLRKIYDRCTEVCSAMDFVDIESLLAIKEEEDIDDDDEEEDVEDVDGVDQNDDVEDAIEIDVKPPRIIEDHRTNNANRRYVPSLSAGLITEEKKRNSPKLAKLDEEYQDLIELNKLRNRQIKEVIDRLRKLVWDINTMLAMRKP